MDLNLFKRKGESKFEKRSIMGLSVKGFGIVIEVFFV